MNAQEFKESKFMAKMSEILREIEKNPSGIAKNKVRGWLNQLTDQIKVDLKIPPTPVDDKSDEETPAIDHNTKTDADGTKNGTTLSVNNGQGLDSDSRISLLEEKVHKLSRFLGSKMDFDLDYQNKLKEKKKNEKNKKSLNVHSKSPNIDTRQQLELQRQLIESQRDQINSFCQSAARFQWRNNHNRDKPQYHRRSNYNRDFPSLTPAQNQTYNAPPITNTSPWVYQNQYQNSFANWGNQVNA